MGRNLDEVRPIVVGARLALVPALPLWHQPQ